MNGQPEDLAETEAWEQQKRARDLRLPPPATEPPPPPPPSGGRDQREVIVSAKVESILKGLGREQAHTAALNNLADAIRELTQAIRTGLEPPRSDS